MRAVHLSLVLIASLGLPELSAQTLPPLIGSRVRVVGSTPVKSQGVVLGSTAVKFQGVVLDQRADTLRLHLDGQATDTSMAFSDLARLDVWRGTSRSTGTGAGFGFGIGAGLGLIAGVAAADECERADYALGFNKLKLCDVEVLAGLLGGGLVGAGLGALIGFAIKHDRWAPVTPVGAQIGLLPVPRGVLVRVSLRL